MDKNIAARLTDYITQLLPLAHGHQIKAICDFVAAIIDIQTANQAQLAPSPIRRLLLVASLGSCITPGSRLASLPKLS